MGVWLVNWSTRSPFMPQKFTLVDIPRLRPAGAIIRGNVFHDAYMRIGLFDSPGALIEQNNFTRAFPLNVGERGDGWLEGPPVVSRVTVRDNTFEDVGYGAPAISVSDGTTKDILLRGNKCVDAVNAPVNCTTKLHILQV